MITRFDVMMRITTWWSSIVFFQDAGERRHKKTSEVRQTSEVSWLRSAQRGQHLAHAGELETRAALFLAAAQLYLVYDRERSSPNRANGHWHFQVQGKPGANVTVVLNNRSIAGEAANATVVPASVTWLGAVFSTYDAGPFTKNAGVPDTP